MPIDIDRCHKSCIYIYEIAIGHAKEPSECRYNYTVKLAEVFSLHLRNRYAPLNMPKIKSKAARLYFAYTYIENSPIMMTTYN